jgi:hypothetical protein
MNVRLPALGACDSYAILGVNSVDSVVYAVREREHWQCTSDAFPLSIHFLNAFLIYNLLLKYILYTPCVLSNSFYNTNSLSVF